MALPDQLPTLSLGSVRLRAFEAGDVRLVVSAASDPLIPMITTVPTSRAERDAEAYIERQHSRLVSGIGYSFAIADTQTDEAVGQIGLWLRGIDEGRATVGCWIGAEHRRRGYLADALVALTEWAFGLPEIHRLQLFVERGNQGSWRAAEKCGFAREGLRRTRRSSRPRSAVGHQERGPLQAERRATALPARTTVSLKSCVNNRLCCYDIRGGVSLKRICCGLTPPQPALRRLGQIEAIRPLASA